MTQATMSAPPQVTGRSLLISGMAVAALGLIAYIVQVSMGRLTTPWYLPVSATLGVILIVASLRHKRGLWRTLALLLVLLLAGFEWMFVLALRLPAYSGPIAVGSP